MREHDDEFQKMADFENKRLNRIANKWAEKSKQEALDEMYGEDGKKSSKKEKKSDIKKKEATKEKAPKTKEELMEVPEYKDTGWVPEDLKDTAEAVKKDVEKVPVSLEEATQIMRESAAKEVEAFKASMALTLDEVSQNLSAEDRTALNKSLEPAISAIVESYDKILKSENPLEAMKETVELAQKETTKNAESLKKEAKVLKNATKDGKEVKAAPEEKSAPVKEEKPKKKRTQRTAEEKAEEEADPKKEEKVSEKAETVKEEVEIKEPGKEETAPDLPTDAEEVKKEVGNAINEAERLEREAREAEQNRAMLQKSIELSQLSRTQIIEQAEKTARESTRLLAATKTLDSTLVRLGKQIHEYKETKDFVKSELSLKSPEGAKAHRIALAQKLCVTKAMEERLEKTIDKKIKRSVLINRITTPFKNFKRAAKGLEPLNPKNLTEKQLNVLTEYRNEVTLLKSTEKDIIKEYDKSIDSSRAQLEKMMQDRVDLGMKATTHRMNKVADELEKTADIEKVAAKIGRGNNISGMAKNELKTFDFGKALKNAEISQRDSKPSPVIESKSKDTGAR